jgi:hypothetical protein
MVYLTPSLLCLLPLALVKRGREVLLKLMNQFELDTVQVTVGNYDPIPR